MSHPVPSQQGTALRFAFALNFVWIAGGVMRTWHHSVPSDSIGSTEDARRAGT
jgi:hypothetical protein